MIRRLLVLLVAGLVSMSALVGCDETVVEPEPEEECYQQCRWVGDRFDCVTVCR